MRGYGRAVINQLLLTALVAALAFAYLRHRASRRTHSPQRALARRSRAMPLIAAALVALTLLLSALLYRWHWQAAHQIYNVQVIHPPSGSRQTYQVYRRDLGERTFVTIGGRGISLGGGQSDPGVV